MQSVPNPHTPPAPAGKRAMRATAVSAKVGLSRATIYLRVKSGTFPKPFRLGPNATAWWEHEIDDWLDACAARSRTASAEAA